MKISSLWAGLNDYLWGWIRNQQYNIVTLRLKDREEDNYFIRYKINDI